MTTQSTQYGGIDPSACVLRSAAVKHLLAVRGSLADPGMGKPGALMYENTGRR